MPGPGPTWPDLIHALIAAGWELRAGCLYHERGGYRWIAAADIDGKEMWVPTFTRGAVQLAPEAFADLKRARIANGYVYVDGSRFVLEPPAADAAEQLATLMPA